MLASFYRISIKFNWSVEHIVFRLANKLPHLQSLIKVKSKSELDPTILDKIGKELQGKVSRLRSEKEEYTEFFNSAPRSLQRVLRVQNQSHISFDLDTLKKCVEFGWNEPLKQKKLFKEINTSMLSDLFHKSSNGKGHNAEKLLNEIVRVVKPQVRYLSDNVRVKLTKVHSELLTLVQLEGKNVCIDLENENIKTEKALQAIRDFKSEVRLYDNDTDNFYQKVVLPAVKSSETSGLVTIDKKDMDPSIVTDINAWREALTKVLISIKQHCDKTELMEDASSHMPFTIKFRDENPVNGAPRTVEIYRLNSKLPFKKKLEVDTAIVEGKVMRWLFNGDLSSAVREFLPVGDIFVHGKFKDCEDVTVNLTEHFYKVDKTLKVNPYGKLFFTLQEMKE